MPMTRRRILAIPSSAVSVVALAGCGIITTTTTNGVTTVTLDVGRIDAWAQAFQNAGTLILGLPGMPVLLGPAAPVITAIIAMAGADIAAFDKAAAGKLTVTFDTTSIPAAITSVLADGKKLLTTVQAAIPVGAIAGTVGTYISALATIVSIFEAAIGSAPPAMGATPLAESRALAALGVK